MAVSKQDTKVSFLSISFLTAISSGLLFMLGLVQMPIVGVCIALFVGAMVYYFVST